MKNKKYLIFLIILILLLFQYSKTYTTDNDKSISFEFDVGKNITKYSQKVDMEAIIITNNAQKNEYKSQYLGKFKVKNNEQSTYATVQGVYDAYNIVKGKKVYAKKVELEFQRNKLGEMKTDEKAFSPTSRNIPCFPQDAELKIGDSWTKKAYKALDITYYVKIDKPVILEVEVFYKYIENVNIDGKEYAVFTFEYTENKNFNQKIISENVNYKNTLAGAFPTRIYGFTSGKYFWDIENNFPYKYVLEYNRLTIHSGGDVNDIIGKEESVFQY